VSKIQSKLSKYEYNITHNTTPFYRETKGLMELENVCIGTLVETLTQPNYYQTTCMVVEWWWWKTYNLLLLSDVRRNVYNIKKWGKSYLMLCCVYALRSKSIRNGMVSSVILILIHLIQRNDGTASQGLSDTQH